MLNELFDLGERHLALLRAELGAIARDALALFVASAVVASLLVGAFVVLVGSAVVGGAAALYGSTIFGIAVLVGVLLSLAAWIPVVLLHAERGLRQRRRAILPALAATTLVALLAGLVGLPVETGSGLATLAGILVFAIALLISLRELDRAALADRFFPHVSAAELRRTLAAADELRGTRRDEHDEDDDDE